MYRVGQSVVHPMHGAGVIEGETNEILEGTARTYYVFRSPVSGLTLKLPADNCTAIGIRAPETPERVREIVAGIPSLTVEEELEPPLPGEHEEAEKRGSDGGGPGGEGTDAPGRTAGTFHRRAEDAARRQADTAIGGGAGAGDGLRCGGALDRRGGDDGGEDRWGNCLTS